MQTLQPDKYRGESFRYHTEFKKIIEGFSMIACSLI